MANRDLKDQVLAFINELTDKQFVELFYNATLRRHTSDSLPEERGHFILGHASLDLDANRWEVDFIGLPSDDSPWIDDAPICQSGRCSSCKSEVRSWAKEHTCPICSTDVHGT